MEPTVEVMLGRKWNSKWHIFRGDPRELSSVCGQLDSAEIISKEFGGGASVCEKCLYEHDHSDAYVRKIRKWYEKPITDRSSLPLRRSQ